MPKIWETPLEKTSRAQESWREQERVRESSRNTLTAKMDVFGFLELVLHQAEFRVQFEERFCFQSQDEMVKTTRAPSKVLPPQRAPGAHHSSWNHPSPTGQISSRISFQRRQQVWAAHTTPETPLPGSAAQLRAGGEGIQPGSVHNQEQGTITQLLLLLPSLLPGHLPRGPVEIPDSQTRKEASKGLGGSSLCVSPKGDTEQKWRSWKDIPKSRCLKC